jgi:S1-C subfamily serine protease
VRATKASPPSGSPPEQAPGTNETTIGTGFYVSDDGYLITNEHVVNSCNKVTVVGAAEEKIPARLVRASKSDDLALLKADIKPRAAAVFQESARINQGSTVVAYGYPLMGLLASTGNVSTGLVTALSGLDDNPRQMQISAPVQPGNSGGPLVDAKGAIVGVVVAKLNAIAVARITKDIPQNINFAIKASSVIDLLDANSVKYHSESLQRELPVEVLTQKMKEYTVRIECK